MAGGSCQSQRCKYIYDELLLGVAERPASTSEVPARAGGAAILSLEAAEAGSALTGLRLVNEAPL